MMDIKNVSKQLGRKLKEKVDKYAADPAAFSDLKEVMIRSFQSNGWFTEKNIVLALTQWADALSGDNVENWISRYKWGI